MNDVCLSAVPFEYKQFCEPDSKSKYCLLWYHIMWPSKCPHAGVMCYVGVRSMLYGSMLGLLGAAVLGSLAARYFGLTSFQDLRPTSDPSGHALQRWLQPYKERIQVRLPAACMHSGIEPVGQRLFACISWSWAMCSWASSMSCWSSADDSPKGF